MRVFKGFDSTQVTERPSKKAHSKGRSNGPKKSVREKPVKENLSAAQIRNRVEEGLKTKNASKIKLKPSFSSSMPDDRIKDAKEAQKKAEDMAGGDVGTNRPDDPNTHQKLKRVLDMGAFKFNEKEKAALGNILQS